jgi:hypothetical protein
MLPLLALKFPKWLKSRLETPSLEVSINGTERFWKKSYKKQAKQEKEKNFAAHLN